MTSQFLVEIGIGARTERTSEAIEPSHSHTGTINRKRRGARPTSNSRAASEHSSLGNEGVDCNHGGRCLEGRHWLSIYLDHRGSDVRGTETRKVAARSGP